MSTRIEPPILMSRILTFVFVTTLVVLITLGMTLYKMFPLNRPQVFFLTTRPRAELAVTLKEMIPDNNNALEEYKRRFVREYIRARNEVSLNHAATLQKWNNDENGLVYMWSSPDVYDKFTSTGLWRAMTSDVSDFEFECNVEFLNDTIDIATQDKDTYVVNFRYFCENSVAKTSEKDYTIIVTLGAEAPSEIHWADRTGNPLGIRVIGYEIKSGGDDPLNNGWE